DLSGTDLPAGGVLVDLAGTLGGTAGDGAVDTVTANGTGGNDAIRLFSFNGGDFNGGIGVLGHPPRIVVPHQEATHQLIVNGGAGNDTIDASAVVAGSISLTINGGTGNDTIIGSQGNDILHGGDGNDTLTGGTGDDQVFGDAGDDRMIWNPGDGTDLFEGDDGVDTAEVNGGNGAETFTITANGTRVRFDRLSPAPFSLAIVTTENLGLNANGGDDVITAGNGLANLIHLTIDGGAGNDTITGGDGNDTLLGGDGDDSIIGGRGDDMASLGAGNDNFIWNPGDGSDTVEGQAGFDTLVFNGANIAERIDISANGGRVRFSRDVATITMDLNGVERIDFHALGGADNIVTNELSGTELPAGGVLVDLAGTLGGTAGDGAVDTVTANGTGGNDAIRLFSINGGDFNGGIGILGTPAGIVVTHQEATDQLIVNGGA